MSERRVCCGSEHTAIIGNYLTAMFAIAICYDCGYYVSADGETVEKCEKRARERMEGHEGIQGF